MAFVRHLATVWSDRGDLAWTFGGRQDVAYLGWVGRGNLGDEAMFGAFQRIAGCTVRRAPLQGIGRLFATFGRASVLVVGGGTLLGRPEWLLRAKKAKQLLQPEQILVLGAGVEPLSFGAARHTTSVTAMRDTIEFLNGCDFVGVRGPDSLAELERHGGSASVLGDPALSIGVRTVGTPNTGHPHMREPIRRGVAAFNVAAVSDGYEPSRIHTRTAVLEAAQSLKRQGAQVVFFGMERGDVEEARLVARGEFEIIPWISNVEILGALLRNASVVLSERLHGGILAAAMKTPFILLGYKPKAFDFARSIHAEELVAPVHRLKGSALAGQLAEVAAAGLSSDVERHIDLLVQKYVTMVSGVLGAASPTSRNQNRWA